MSEAIERANHLRFVADYELKGSCYDEDKRLMHKAADLLESQAARIEALEPVEYANVYMDLFADRFQIFSWLRSRALADKAARDDRIAIATRKGGKVSIEAVSDE